MRNKILLAICLILSLFNARAQKSEVNVNTLTGTANVVIPVYSLSRGAVSLPINLIYSATGIKPKDVELNGGMGWNLQAGGQVSRILRGMPDDVRVDSTLTGRLGWIYAGRQSIINGFTIHNSADNDCTGQGQDIAEIASTMSYDLDNEPDIFNVSAPGLSCQLIYDQTTSQFKTIPYMDLKITTAFNPITGSSPFDGEIASFTITNDQGIQYTFDIAERIKQQTLPSSGTTTGTYNQNYYQQFKNAIIYNDAWYLTKMTDANGNGVTLSYTAYPQRAGQDPIILYAGFPGGGNTPVPQYTTQTIVTPQVLTTIQTIDRNASKQVLTFTWTTNTGPYGSSTGQSVITSITGAGKNILFQYALVPYISSGSTTAYNRYFLRRFTDASTGAGCGTPVDYQFAYYGETTSGGVTTTSLSDSTSTSHIDYWGYYTSNTSNNTITPLYVDPTNSTNQRYVVPQTSGVGANYSVFLDGSVARTPDTVNVMTGSLHTITYSQGGNTVLTYESNDFYDPLANATNKGNGIRIKTVVDNDNVTGATVTRNYAYADPATGQSSGKPISLPIYGFATPYTGTATGRDYWYAGTMRSNVDLSQEDHTIMYTNVTVSQTGAGSTVYQYYVPATNWDASAFPVCTGCNTGIPEWNRTVNYSANPNCTTGPVGPPKNDVDTYPFAPNPNYDFERGLIKSVTTYNEASTPQKTSETDYAYARTSSPGIIPAFKYEWNTNTSGTQVMAYAKYTNFYGTSELVANVTKTVYDSQGAGLAQTTTTNSTYGSTYHKLASQAVTNSDGSILTSHYTYIKDFTGLSSGNSNANINAIYQMQQLNEDIPVENYTTVTRGGTTLTTGAALTLDSAFAGLATTLYLPHRKLMQVLPNGGSFNPLTISGSTITWDSKYTAQANYEQYDFTGVVQTMDDAHTHVKSSILDHNTYNPVFNVQNAAAYEVAFEDFDSDMIPAWTVDTLSTGGFSGPQPAGSHTGVAHGMKSGQTFTFTVKQKLRADHYIFSLWLNPGANGSFNFTITPTAGSPVTVNKAFNNTASTWQYFQFILPVAATNETLTVHFSAQLTSAANIAVDDIAIYPQLASITTGAFDEVTYYRTAQTNTNGVSAYYTSDQWGRPLLQFDQDRNIVQKKSYVTPNLAASFPVPIFSTDPPSGTVNPIPPGTSVTFTIITVYSSCYSAGLTYTWDFGDGSPQVVTTTPDMLHHTFANATSANVSYTVTLTVNSPTFGSQSFTQNVVVSPVPPAQVFVLYEDNTTSHGTASVIEFSQNGAIVYEFSQTLGNMPYSGTNIAPGVYDVTVNVTDGHAYNPDNGDGYASVMAGNACKPYSGSGGHYMFLSVNLTGGTEYDIVTSTFTCP